MECSEETLALLSEPRNGEGTVVSSPCTTDRPQYTGKAFGFFRRNKLKGSVCFSPHVTVCHDHAQQVLTSVDLDAFHFWEGKTWKLRKRKTGHALGFACRVSQLCEVIDSDLARDACRHDIGPRCSLLQESQEPLSLPAVLIRDHCDDVHRFVGSHATDDVHSSVLGDVSNFYDQPQGSQEPLSSSAVLIRDQDCTHLEPSNLLECCDPRIALGDITNISQCFDKTSNHAFMALLDEDVASFMQKSNPKSTTCKQSPFPDDGNPILEGVAQGQVDPIPLEGSSPSNDAISDGYSASVATDSSQAFPPSTAGGRHEFNFISPC